MKPPFTVRFIASCEWLLGGLLAFYCLMFLVFGFYGLIHGAFLRLFSSLGSAALMAAGAAGSFYTGGALVRGRRWAWIVSWGIGIAVAGFGCFLIWVGLDRSPNYKGHGPLLAGMVMLSVAALGLLFFILPRTIRFFRPL